MRGCNILWAWSLIRPRCAMSWIRLPKWLSPVAIHKFIHSVMSGWTLSGVFVVGISCWFLLKKRHESMALRSIKVGGWVGLAGILLTLWSGDSSSVDVAKVQPMKLAAMEGLYDGSRGQAITAFGILNPAKTVDNDEDPFLFDISIPYGLSFLATHDMDAFCAGHQRSYQRRDRHHRLGRHCAHPELC